jgi:hypothetical protein
MYSPVSLPTVDATLVVPCATASLTAAALFFTGRAIVKPVNEQSGKALGVLLVMSLAFAADTPFLYGLAIFIVATLVTELGFLEKIAALVWNRGKYWDWMIAKETSSEADARVAETARGEIEAVIADAEIINDDVASAPAQGSEEPETNESKPRGSQTSAPHHPSTASVVNAFIEDSVSFEREAKNALKLHANLFMATEVKLNLRLTSSQRSSSVEVDAVLDGRTVSLVAEIKYTTKSDSILRAARHARRGADAYRSYLRERGLSKSVVPVLVLPAESSNPAAVDSTVPILRFDPSTLSFVNVQDFLLHVSALRPFQDY